MNKAGIASIVFALIFVGQIACGQSNEEQARVKAQQAIKLEDEEGKFDEAIILFEEAQRLDPEKITYPYEMAYAYTSKHDYKKASDILEKLVYHKDVFDLVYQALGNAYDYQGKSEKAIETYQDGLKKFPNSGKLYLELGNVRIVKKDYAKALEYYEQGIEKEPGFPSNYYWAAKIFCGSDEEVWGMIYGELFINLERNSKRTAEISKLLFDTYKSEIKVGSDTSMVSFSKNSTILVDKKNIKKIKFPFPVMAYEPMLMLSLISEKVLNMSSLDRIRTGFVDNYFNQQKGKMATEYPNVLFDYQKQVKLAGHLEAYNHWVLMKGDESEFAAWQESNKAKWDAFVDWFNSNQLKMNMEHRFYRAQY
jgi:tetratricopeptide (TPR) repeat protein